MKSVLFIIVFFIASEAFSQKDIIDYSTRESMVSSFESFPGKNIFFLEGVDMPYNCTLYVANGRRGRKILLYPWSKGKINFSFLSIGSNSSTLFRFAGIRVELYSINDNEMISDPSPSGEYTFKFFEGGFLWWPLPSSSDTLEIFDCRHFSFTT